MGKIDENCAQSHVPANLMIIFCTFLSDHPEVNLLEFKRAACNIDTSSTIYLKKKHPLSNGVSCDTLFVAEIS